MAGRAEHLARASLRSLAGYTIRYVRTSTGAVHVLEAEGRGTLPPLVLLHGLSSAGVHFLPMLGHLRAEVSRLVLPDLPGHGFSSAPRPADEAALRRGVREALDAVLDAPALVFGNSLGGYAAIQYALERPERVRALMLASPAGAAMSHDELGALKALFHLTSHGQALDFIDRVLARRGPLRHAMAWGLRRQVQSAGVAAVLQAAQAPSLLTPAQLGALPHPLLLVWGKQDRVLSPAHLEFFRRHLPAHARIEEPPGFGHSPFLDDPAALARMLVTFARGLTDAPPAR